MNATEMKKPLSELIDEMNGNVKNGNLKRALIAAGKIAGLIASTYSNEAETDQV